MQRVRVSLVIAACLAALFAAPPTAGADPAGAPAGPARRAAQVISAGSAHTCAVLADGNVKCWGLGGYGRLGHGATTNIGDGVGPSVAASSPVTLGDGQRAVAVSAGDFHSCALLVGGHVKCWGDGSRGRLGHGATTNIGDGVGPSVAASSPVTLGDGRTATAVAAGGTHTCALLDDGSVKCWGAAYYGQPGQNSLVQVGDGVGPSVAATPPIAIGSGRTATAITAGEYHSCALLDDGNVKCWGYGAFGRLGHNAETNIGDGDGPTVAASPPVGLGAGRTAVAVSAGSAHTCALLDNGAVKCWGANAFGQLGRNDTTNVGDGVGPSVAATPAVNLGPGRSARAISAAGNHTCALLDDGTVKCWGSGNAGRLGQNGESDIGDGTGPTVAATPPIALPAGVRAVAAGQVHTCALLADDSMKCWGSGNFGRLGQNGQSSIGDGTGPTVAATPAIALGGPVSPAVASPGAPTSLVATAGAAAVHLSWAAPSDDGGAPVTGYRIQISTDGGTTWSTKVATTGSSATSRTVDGLEPGTPHRARVAAITAAGTGAYSSPSGAVMPTAVSAPAGPTAPSTTPAAADYLPLDPARLLDTRPGATTIDTHFAGDGKLTIDPATGGAEIALQVTGRGGVPTNAAAVVMNITAHDTDAAGYITAYPCGTPRPNASNLNYTPGQTIPNTAIVKVGHNGTICLYTDQTTHLIADVNGLVP